MAPFIAFLGSIGPTELIVIGAVALIIFGRRLPEVGRSLGKGIVEFKKGLQGIEKDLDDAGDGSQKSTTDEKPPEPPAQ